MVHNLKQELEKYTKDIEINVSEKPDILFKNKKGETIAIEVETGLSINKHKRTLEEKFRLVKHEYKKNVIILLTDARIKYKYKNINSDIPILVRTDMKQFIESHFHTRR